jgi:hypothetical protein
VFLSPRFDRARGTVRLPLEQLSDLEMQIVAHIGRGPPAPCDCRRPDGQREGRGSTQGPIMRTLGIEPAQEKALLASSWRTTGQ